jgi:hypothetical protein
MKESGLEVKGLLVGDEEWRGVEVWEENEGRPGWLRCELAEAEVSLSGLLDTKRLRLSMNVNGTVVLCMGDT